MANRFENIPQSPKLYQEQSMYVPHEFIGTEMPKTPLLAPLDIYTKDIAQRREDANKLADDNSKFTLDHFKDYGTDKINVYGTEEDFGGKQRVKAENDKYIAEANNILNNAKYDPEGAKKAIYNLKANYLQNPIINQEKINDENIKALNKILAENQNDPNIQNSPVYQELLSALKTKKVGVASALPKNEVSEAVKSLKASTDYGRVAFEGITTNEDYGVAYVQGQDTKSVDLKKLEKIFIDALETDSKLGNQIQAESKASSDNLGYNIDRTNRLFRSNYLTEDEKKLSAEEQDKILSKKISGNKELTNSYASYIGSGIKSFDKKNVSGFMDPEKAVGLQNKVFKDNYEASVKSAYQMYVNLFDKEQKFSISNMNWKGYDDGYGSKFQPKPIVTGTGEYDATFGFEDIYNVDKNEFQKGFLDKFDNKGKFTGKEENPLANFKDEIEIALASEFTAAELKELKEKVGSSDPLELFAAVQKSGSETQKINSTVDNKNNPMQGIPVESGGLKNPKRAESLRNGLSGLVNNNYTKQWISINTEGQGHLTAEVNSLVKPAINSGLMTGKSEMLKVIDKDGKMRAANEEEINQFNNNKNQDYKDIGFRNEGGKLYMTTVIPYKTPGDDKNTPLPKVVSTEFKRSSQNESSVLGLTRKLYETKDPENIKRAKNMTATVFGTNQDEVYKAFTNNGKPRPTKFVHLDNGVTVRIEYDKKNNYTPTVTAAEAFVNGQNVDYLKYNPNMTMSDVLLISVPDQYLMETQRFK